MFTLTLEKRHIVAIRRFAAVKDVRYYLNGLCIEAGANESRIIATDGHRMAIIRGMAPDYGAQGFGSVQCAIIPSEAFKDIKKAKKGQADSIVISINAPDYQIQDGDTIKAGKLIDAKYPDWRRVVPAKVTGIMSQFNGDYLADCAAAAVDLGCKFPTVSVAHNGAESTKAGQKPRDGAGLITIPSHPEFVAVIMPFTVDEIATTAPAWCFSDLMPAKEKAAA